MGVLVGLDSLGSGLARFFGFCVFRSLGVVALGIALLLLLGVLVLVGRCFLLVRSLACWAVLGGCGIGFVFVAVSGVAVCGVRVGWPGVLEVGW